MEVVDHLLAGPVLRVDAGVDDKTDGAPDIALQAAVIGVGILVEADILAEPFGVEPPALGVGGVVLEFAEFRHALEFLRDGNLQVMAGKAFVIGGVFDLIEIALSVAL